MKQRGRAFKLSFLLLFVLAIVLAGCGGNNNTSGNTTASSEPAASAAATSSADTAAASTQPSGEKPKVAFVYIGPPGDGGYTYQHDQGRQEMEKELGIKATTVENIPEGPDAERTITELAQSNDIVFTTSFGYMEQTLNVAKKFPNVKFDHASGYKTADNMGTYFGKNYEASYLTGIAAGKVTKNNHLGYVGAFPISEVIYNLNAFTLGAQSVNPDVKVDVVWTNTWYDPTTERQAAISLLDKGADVLLAYQDSPATIQAAQERGAFAGGNDSDMKKYAPDNYLTNPVWDWGPYYTKTVKSVMDGTWTNEQYSGSMADGMVKLAPFGNKVPEDVQKLVTDAQAKIISGELNVFTGPITDNAGTVQVPEGKTLTLDEVLSMNWLAKGVVGTIPK
ncbi:BMP family ABC transporter substrate-binding protein [Paenibacillus sp. HN-1]|uniref:BMP family ABC transporter substrate-binding protein n=1 Tax=Paenibacillus TaxID=44249 RepID=UPI001CA8D26E|nr:MULTISPECIES: BMP family ABC transporter substrate-binding protein [Paenibacillus]MBY9080825.1 BMP family ABC transporter substrate-binding protein [Paenibacillus sp. CGMCC 1.18879]MBY9085183.1 BMP family ABC transporter substrate-binding protein [Paenibacillus sinensis]